MLAETLHISSLEKHPDSLFSPICVLCEGQGSGTKIMWAQAPSKKESDVAQSCTTLCDPMDCSLLDSSVHGILQARILEWVAISFSNAGK